MPPLFDVRQEQFCLVYAQTGDARKACKAAGYQVTSTRLLSNKYVRERIAELRLATQDTFIADIIERKKKLTEIMRSEYKDPVMARDIINAIEELNKIDGDYAPERKQLEIKAKVKFIIGEGYVDKDSGTGDRALLQPGEPATRSVP